MLLCFCSHLWPRWQYYPCFWQCLWASVSQVLLPFPPGHIEPRSGRLLELHADTADRAEGVRAPVAGRALDDDSRALLEFRRRLGDPVSLSKISLCCLAPLLLSTAPKFGWCGHLADFPGPATTCLGRHSVHHAQQDTLDRGHLPRRACHRTAADSVQELPLR